MSVDFGPGRDGEEIAAYVLRLLQSAEVHESDSMLARRLEAAANARLEGRASAAKPLLPWLRRWWRSVCGPGEAELALARQRGEALERAERAEQASFDAISENSRLKDLVSRLEAERDSGGDSASRGG